MHQLLAQTAQALAQIVCKRGLIQLSFADVRSLYGRYAGSEVLENCWVAHVEGDIHDRTEDLVAELLACPLLGDESIWKRVDHAIVAVSGTRDLGLSDVQEMVGAFKDRLPADIPIATSASLDEESHEKVRMTVLLAMTAPARMSVPEIAAALEHPAAGQKSRVPSAKTVPLPNMKAKVKAQARAARHGNSAEKNQDASETDSPARARPAPITVENHTITEEELIPSSAMETEAPVSASGPGPTPSRRFQAKQEEMSFEGPPRGRFEKTHETMYRGENLDQPTYRRRGLKIRV